MTELKIWSEKLENKTIAFFLKFGEKEFYMAFPEKSDIDENTFIRMVLTQFAEQFK